MVTAGTLIETVADVLCLERATVAWIYRGLREADIIETGGRGRSARQMTAADCAALLIGILAANSAKFAAEATIEYAKLRAFSPQYSADREKTPSGPRQWDLGLLELPYLKSLPAGHSFGDAIKALIESGTDGHLETGAKADPWGDNPAVSIHVAVRTPWRIGHIDVRGGSSGAHLWYFSQEDINDGFRIWAEGPSGPIPRTGRYGIITDRRVADDVFLDVGTLLRPLQRRKSEVSDQGSKARP